MQKTAIGSQFAHASVLRSSKRHVHWLSAQTMRIMRLLTIFLFAVCFSAAATGTGQSVTISGEHIPLATVFSAIKKQTGYVVLYSPELFLDHKTVSVAVNKLPLHTFLDMVLKDQPIKYDIQGKTIFLSRKTDGKYSITSNSLENIDDNETRIRIRVTDQDANPLVGATVINKKIKQTAITDESGWSTIVATIGDVIEVTYVGFGAQTFTIKDISKSVIIQLKANNALDEAVVYNGYQKIQQKYLTGSVTSLKMDSIMQPGLSTIDKMLEGRVPGMMFMQNSGQAGAAPKLRIRGTSTLLGSREPLWVVDGIVRTNPFPVPAERINDPDFVNLLGNAISGLNPFDIEQIDVLKDATAAALYGVRAANGVIVITTKRGKSGPPTVHYNVAGTFTQRPRYSDRSMYMMDSRERIDVSREMVEKQLPLRGSVLEAYERDIVDYYAGRINYETFKKGVDRAESMNTDWLGHTLRDVFATNHSISVSGGGGAVSYRASAGYHNEPGVIRKEANDRYTGMLNMQMNYRKFKVDFNIQLNREQRRYTPAEVGVLNYAYGTSRAIPLYDENGSPYFYSTVSSNMFSLFGDFKTMNILNEMNHTGERIATSESNASIDLSYEIAKGIQFQSRIAYSGGNSQRDIWFEENTEWATQLRYSAYDVNMGAFRPIADPMPFGGEFRGQHVNRQNYIINGRINFSRFLDQQNKHQLIAEVAADLHSNRSNSTELTSRGYYPNRGHSFAQIDLNKYSTYAHWLSTNSTPLIINGLQNSVRPYLTSTYIFNDRYVISATASQEFSNSFGARSNEKFLPTWALSGRWNMHEDILRGASWLDRAALLVSFGTRGNMLPGQTPYAIIRKGTMNSFFNNFSSTTVSFPNPDLTWEKTQDYNGSLEFTMLKGKINGSLGYFYSKTTNAFLEKKVSAVNGVPSNSYVVNGGILENQGVELSLNFKLIDNLGGGNKRFMWRFDPQLGQVFNKLINNNLNSRNVLVDVATLTYQDYLNGNVPVNGKAVNTFYAYRFKGLDPEYGFPVFYGAEVENKSELYDRYIKMTKEQVFNTVMVESGRREPVLQGSISNSFVYGNWSLNISVSYSLGNKIRLLQIASGNYGTFRPSSQQNLRREFTERWRYPGDEQFTNIPSINGQSMGDPQPDQYAWWQGYNLPHSFATDYYQMYDFSDLRVVKGDYMKLQYVSLSYRFPEELCRKLNCKGAIVGFNGNNLHTFANKALRGQDPSQSGFAANINLSIRPVYAVNLNISF